MPAFPEVKPNVGENVRITMVNGGEIDGYFDGLQWWVGVPDQAQDIPLVNEYVKSWQAAQ